MRLLGRTRTFILALIVCGSVGLLGAASAGARSVSVNAQARVAFIGSVDGALRFAGRVTDPALGNGGLLLTLHRAPGGEAGTATILDRAGSLTAAVRATAKTQVELVHLRVTAAVTAASGAFAGARGTLTGGATVSAAFGVGDLQLRGRLRGAAGRAPAPPSGTRARHVDGRFELATLSLTTSGEATLLGSATGVVQGPAVGLVHERATATGVRGTFTLFAAGGSLSGVVAWRFRSPDAAPAGAGSARITGGAGDLRGARSTSTATVTATRDEVLQMIALRIRGAFTP